MKNRKGFTLLELLAVIVILAVIALIATPIILNMIENAKKGAAKAGATHYIDTLEKELMYEEFKKDIDPEGMYLIKEDGSYEINGEIKKLSIKGSLPSTGTVCIDEDGIVESYSVVLDGYVVTKTNNKQEIEKGIEQKNLTCNVAEEIVNIKIPENNNVCSKTKEVIIDYPQYEATVKEYSLDSKNWLEYKEKVIMTENGTLYARLRKGSKTSSLASISFTTIDNEAVDTTAPSLVLSTEKPTSEINVTFKQTDNCGLKEKEEDLIEEEKKKYGISETKEGTYAWQEESVFSGLKNNTTYYIKTRTNDIANNGIVESEISEITTGEFEGITITPNSTDWTTSKTVSITGNTMGSELEYKIATCVESGNTCTTKTDWTIYSSDLTIDWESTVEEPTYVYARFNDGTNTSEESSLAITTIDKTSPSAPTTMSFVFGNWSAYTNNSWTNQSVYVARTSSSHGPTGSTDNASGVAKYQISSDGVNWVDYAYNTSSSMYVLSSNGTHTRYFRAVDEAGNASTSISRVARIDKTAPGTASSTIRIGSASGTVRANTTAWTNQTLWWGGFSATDTGGSGVSYYQYSTGCTGTPSATLGSSYTYSSNTNYTFCIRAVDAAGNAGAWSGAYYIRIDKTAPGTTTSVIRIGSASGTVRANTTAWTNQTLWWGGFSATDTGGSGIARYEYLGGCTGTNVRTLSTAGYTYNTTTDYSFCIRAVDAAGNVGAWNGTYYIRVDKTAPTIKMTPTTGTYYPGQMYVGITCEDGNSGMSQAWLSDAGYVTTGTTYTSQKLASTGGRNALGRCTDNVGNVSELSTYYNIQYSGPSCTTYTGEEISYCRSMGWTVVSCTSNSNCTCQKC